MNGNSDKAATREHLSGMSADFALFNGNVITMNQRQPRVEAVALKEGKIIGTGNNAEIKHLCSPKTETLDAKGETVLPGFIECHNHMLIYGTTLLGIDCGIEKNKSIDDILAKVKERAETLPAGTWIEGWGYDDTLIAEKRHPNRLDLDKVATDHPVFLYHVSGHLCAVNSLALKMAGITKDTPTPEGGDIFRNESGEPTGVLAELPAQSLVQGLIPPKAVDELVEGLKLANYDYLKAGVTSINDGGFFDTKGLVAYDRAHSSGVLNVRVYADLFVSILDSLLNERETIDDLNTCTGCGSEWLRIGAAKLVQDGSIQGLTGAVFAPYVCDPSRNGILIYSQEELDRLVLKYHKVGFQVQVHGNGDRAIESIITACERAQAAFPRSDTRHQIIHCQMVHEDQLERMAKLGMCANFFPVHVYYWGDRHRDLFIGPERASRIDPLRSALNHGVNFALHGDCPVTPISPLMSLYSAVARETRDGHTLGKKEQALDVEEALEALTIKPAYMTFDENTKGSIERYKLADLVCLSADPFKLSPQELKDLEVEFTIVGGKVVYHRS